VRKVELKGIRNFVCQGTNLAIEPGELLVLIGPNGAGKTTLLHVIAGLVSYKGTVEFNGVPVDSLSAQARQVGYVFQDLVLFPHLNVTENIDYGLKNTRLLKSQRDARVEELLCQLAISHLSHRYPKKLSGGEKQRVALARALATRPEILLLDEPASSLDSRTSGFFRLELKKLQRDLETTMVFVTHDLNEAEQVADRIGVIQDGIVEQIGTPKKVLFSPSTEKTALYLGSPNVLDCVSSQSIGHGLAEVDCLGLSVVVPYNGQEIRRIVILPRDVSISTERPVSEVNVFAGTVRRITGQAGACMAHVVVGEHEIAAKLPPAFWESHCLQPGSRVFVELSLVKIRIGS
jgi:ABC-type Fe3+/spermidine/putrescine transport system ATPase subunit